MKLYELADAYRNLSELCSEGEDYQTALSQIEGEFEQKIENVTFVIRELEAQKQAVETELERLQKKAQSVESNIVGLKQYLQSNMEQVGVEKVKGALFTTSLQNSPPACEIVNEQEIPQNYKRATLQMLASEVPVEFLSYVTSQSIDKKSILDLWKQGVSVSGAAVVQRKHLRIR